MKKVISVLLSLVCLLSICSCVVQPEQSSNNIKKIEVVYEEKYILASHVGLPLNESHYFIFHKNGTFEEHYFYQYNSLIDYTSQITHTTTTYKYEILEDNKTVGFFDSRIIHSDDNKTSDSTTNTVIRYLEVYENVILYADGVYVREGYADSDLPNFSQPEN